MLCSSCASALASPRSPLAERPQLLGALSSPTFLQLLHSLSLLCDDSLEVFNLLEGCLYLLQTRPMKPQPKGLPPCILLEMPDQAEGCIHTKSAVQGTGRVHLLVSILWLLLDGKEDLGLAKLLYAQAALAHSRQRSGTAQSSRLQAADLAGEFTSFCQGV